ncbi:MAG: hypothetical protein KDM91_08340, partial [Verrucomicrobiae bacterium]|nr:hypothetical protein [Verrucomicrobiae bacterium]
MKTIRIPRRRSFTREAILLAVLLSPGAGGLFAGPTSSSANFTLLPGETGAGGGRVTGATVTADISIGETVAGGVSNVTTGGAQTKGGFTGQLYDTQSLAVSADPAAVEEHETTQLTAVATMDDDSLVNVGGADALWAILDGPIDTIDGNGVATAGDVFINSPANVRGTYDGVDGDLQIMVLNVNAAPPTDPQPDPGFTEQNFDPGQAGLYQGLLTDSGGNVLGAIVGLRIKNTGAFSGKVFFNGKAYALKGVLDGNGDFTGQVIRKGLTPLDVVLHIGETTSGGLSLQGTVDGDSTSGGAIADRAPYHPKNNPAPPELVNKYTFLIPATETGNSAVPGGDGYGAVTVSSSGAIVATGKTGDGVKFGTKGFLTEDGQWHLFQPLFRGQGQLAGVVNFRDQPGVSDFDADLRWVKNPNPKDKLYPGGFDLPPALVGSVFDPPAKGERALDELQDQFYNALLSLAGNTLEDGGFSQVVSWLNSNAIAYYGPEKLGAKASPKNGLLGGSYYDPFTKTKIGFGGAVLQKQGIAGGNFVFANESGYLLIEPGTVFPYPGSEDPGLLDLTEVPNDPVSSPAIEEVPVFDPAAAGLFGGTVHETTGGMNLAGGIENVKLAANGAISGTVWIDGLRYAFKGLVGNDTHVLIDIPRKGLTPVTLALTLDKHIGIADGFVLHGTATVDGTDFDVEAQRRPVYPKGSAPDEHAGAYTIALRAPDGTDPAAEPAGDGYGSLSVL